MTDKIVRYTGVLDGVRSQREITSRDWLQLGIKSKSHVWSTANDFTVPASEFSAEQHDVLKQDGGFEVT
jgi:hypothetical protein